MAATLADIAGWLDRLYADEGSSHMVVFCDTFDWEDHPEYVPIGTDPRKFIEDYRSRMGNAYKVMEVYSRYHGREEQLGRQRVFNYDPPVAPDAHEGTAGGVCAPAAGPAPGRGGAGGNPRVPPARGGPDRDARAVLSFDERNRVICEVDAAIHRAWPKLRGQAWPDGTLTDAIAEAVDETLGPRDPHRIESYVERPND